MRFAVPLLIAVALYAVRYQPTGERPPVLAEDQLDVGVIEAGTAPSSIDELRARAQAIIDRDQVSGAAIALVDRDGPIWVGGVGVTDRETKRPVDATTVFRVASISKSIVGLGVMRLVEQGKLDLQQPLHELLPDVAIENRWQATSPVTLGQVLEHTAGLDDMRPSETFVDDDAMTPAVALGLNPRSRVIRWRPGTRMSYSNVGTTLAARAIEVVTGEPFDVWIKREVLVPLGMRDADFRRTELLASRLATGYLAPDRPAAFKPIAHRAAGSLLASASDLAGLVQFWLRRGDGFSIVSPAGLERIETTSTLPFPSIDLSYGLGNYGDVAHPVKGRGHDGGLPGFASSYRYFPALGKGYVLLLPATHSRRAYLDLRALLFGYLARDHRATPVVERPAAPPGAGFYSFASPRHQLTGFAERVLLGWQARGDDGRATIDPLLGTPLRFESAGDGGYKLPGQSGSSLRFAETPGGSEVMIGGFGYAQASSYWLAWVRVKAVVLAAVLLKLAPIWALVVFGLAAFQRRRPQAIGPTLWPAIASLSFDLTMSLFARAADAQQLGDVCASTVGVFVATIVFGIAATMGMFSNLMWSVRADRPPLRARAIPIAMALAVFGFGLWLDENSIIGLRVWAW